MTKQGAFNVGRNERKRKRLPVCLKAGKEQVMTREESRMLNDTLTELIG